MTVREALEKIATYRRSDEPPVLEILKVAPKIEAALRAAYDAGFDAEVTSLRNHVVGVTAGIAKLGEET